ncbi:MAG: peptidylprolyl isomerase [Pseudomonadota bacterium]
MSIRQVKNKFSPKLVCKIFIVLALIIISNPIAKSFAQQNSSIFVIAKIDNQVITNVDLIDRYRLVLKMSKIQLGSEQEKQIVLNQILQKMIDEELQIKEAKTLEIAIDDKNFQQAELEVAKSLHKNSQQLKSFFEQQSISYSSLTKQLQSQIVWSDIIKKTVAPKIKVNQSEIDELLELRKVKADIEKYFIAEIFIPLTYKNDNDNIDSKELALKLADELNKGKNFANIVKQFSRSPTAEFGGEIGWVGVGDVDVRIYKAISQTKLGEVSKPVLMDDGYYLFKVVNKKTFSTLTEEDTNQVKNVIFSKKLQLMAKSHLMDLRKNSYIEIDRKKIADLKL